MCSTWHTPDKQSKVNVGFGDLCAYAALKFEKLGILIGCDTSLLKSKRNLALC